NGWLYLPMQDLLQESYQILLRRLPEQKWAEYFDGPTGVWMGQQARLYQTWTVAGLLLAHHLLKVNPEDATVFDLPKLGSLYRACQSGGF
ncbi:MAG: glycoside hydrolase 100 family protein, partial [Thermostichus sp. BF3_bins_97]